MRGQMKTKVTESPTIAARYIQHGDSVAFPTETVYGLGANTFNEKAIRQIFTAKGRPSDNPLIVHIAQLHQLEQIAKEIPPIALALIEKFFPGPLTVILPKSVRIPSLVTAGLETVGVRMPRHSIALQFLRACGVPVAAPSANLSGRPSPTTWQAVRADLDGRIGCLLKGDPTTIGLESTVVDCTGPHPVILRAGGVTLEQLRRVIPETEIARDAESPIPKSPGHKYRHYSPRARIVTCTYPRYTITVDNAAFIGLEPPPHSDTLRRMRICGNVEEYAQSLFQFFRECDQEGVETIYCQSVSQEGLGLALMDRIERAAHE